MPASCRRMKKKMRGVILCFSKKWARFSVLRNEDRESVTKAHEKFRDYHTALSHASFLSLVASIIRPPKIVAATYYCDTSSLRPHSLVT